MYVHIITTRSVAEWMSAWMKINLAGKRGSFLFLARAAFVARHLVTRSFPAVFQQFISLPFAYSLFLLVAASY